MEEVHLAIIGSRNYNNYNSFKLLVDEYIKELEPKKVTKIISGGCDGTDMMAWRYARENEIPFKEYPADWDQYGNAAGPIRNKLIIKDCTHVLAFLSKDSRGTKGAIKMAEKDKRIIKIIDL